MVNGSIRIKTRIDNSQAKKDAKEFEKVVSDAAETAKDSGEKSAVNIDVSQAEKEINRLEKDIERYQKKLNQLNNGKLGEFNEQKADIQALTDKDLRQAATDEQAAHVLEMEKITLEQLESKYKSVVAEAREYTRQIEQAKQRQAELKSRIEQAENAQKQANSEQRKSTAAASKTASKASNLKDMIRSAKNAAGEFAKNLGVKAYNGAVKTGSVIKNTFVKGLKKSLSHIKSMGKSTDHLRKNFLRMGLGLVGMESLISGFRQIVSSALNDNEKLQNQLTAIKGILGMAFTPLINSIVNSLTQVVSLVDKVYAAFTGTSLIARYNAEQAKKIADSTSDAADSAKEYNNQLAGFDVANKLTDNKASSSGSSANDTSISFEADYSESVSKFADMIKKAWEKADFTDVGNTISKKLVTMLQEIGWADIKSKGFGAGKSFATLLNGLFSYSDEDGNTLATSIGEFLAEAFNTLVMLAIGFVKNLDWKNIGTEFAKGLLKALSKIDWGKAGELIHDLIVGLCDSIAAFFDKLSEDDEAYKTIKKAVTDFFNGLELGEIVLSIAKATISILHFSFNILGNLLDDIIESLCKKFGWEWDGTWMDMGPLGIRVPKINFKFGSKDSDAEKEEDDGLSWWDRLAEKLGKTSPILASLGGGVGTGTVTTTINGNISDSFVDLKSKWDSIKDKISTSNIKGSIQSSFNTLKSKWDSIKNKTNTSSIKGSIQKNFNTLKSRWDSIKNKTNTTTIKGSITKSFNTAKSNWNSLKSKAITLTTSLKDGITNGIRSILNSLCNMVNKVIGVLNKIPGVNISRISPPKLAKGGIVNNPGRGVTVTAGEAGPEAILPLNDSAMSRLAAMISEHQNTAAGQIIVPIYIDGKKILKYIVDAQNKQAFVMNKGGAY